MYVLNKPVSYIHVTHTHDVQYRTILTLNNNQENLLQPRTSNNAPIVMSHPRLDRGKSLALHLPEKTDPGHLHALTIIKGVMKDQEVNCVQHLNNAKWIVTCTTNLARDKLFRATLQLNKQDIMTTTADGTTTFVTSSLHPRKWRMPSSSQSWASTAESWGAKDAIGNHSRGGRTASDKNGGKDTYMYMYTIVSSNMIKYDGQIQTLWEVRPPRNRVFQHWLALTAGRADT